RVGGRRGGGDVQEEVGGTEESPRRLREEARTRADFARVHACVASGDLPDEREARLVILGPEHPHTARDAQSPARAEAAKLLEWRGPPPRNYKNTGALLAPDATRLNELQQAVRQHLASSSLLEARQ